MYCLVEGADVFRQLLLIERGLTDPGMNDSGLFGAELDRAGFGFFNGLGDIRRNRAQFRVGHQAFGAEDFTQLPHQRHHVRRGDAAVEIHLTRLDFFGQVFRTDEVGSGVLGFLGLGFLGKNSHADFRARAVGQADHAAHLLVGMNDVDPEVNGNIDRFIKLARLGRIFKDFYRVFNRIKLVAVDFRSGSLHFFTLLRHDPSPPPLRRPSSALCLR